MPANLLGPESFTLLNFLHCFEILLKYCLFCSTNEVFYIRINKVNRRQNNHVVQLPAHNQDNHAPKLNDSFHTSSNALNSLGKMASGQGKTPPISQSIKSPYKYFPSKSKHHAGEWTCATQKHTDYLVLWFYMAAEMMEIFFVRIKTFIEILSKCDRAWMTFWRILPQNLI